MRLIDVDRLIFHSCNDMKGDCPYWGSANCGVCQKSLITRAEIDNALTVDIDLAEYSDKLWKEAYERGKNERPHGKWIRHISSIECSVCKEKFFADDENENCQDYDPCTDFNYNYCPNCGADMREAEE